MLHNKVGFYLRRKEKPKFVAILFSSSSMPLTDDGDSLFLGHGLTTPLSDVPSPMQGTLGCSCIFRFLNWSKHKTPDTWHP